MLGARKQREYADDLVTEGLFRHTRNPLYVGKFFMVLGAGIAANRWPALLAIGGLYGFMYHAVVLAEEDYLRRKFGAAFDEYCARVARWVPRVDGLSETLRGTAFHWKRVVVKEYSAPLGWTLPIVAIGLYNMAQVAPLAQQPARVMTMLVIVAAGFVLWSIAGFLKKTRSPLLQAADL